MDGGCHSWYVDPRSGKLTLIWPDYAYDFRARNGHFTGEGFLSSASGETEPMPGARARAIGCADLSRPAPGQGVGWGRQ